MNNYLCIVFEKKNFSSIKKNFSSIKKNFSSIKKNFSSIKIKKFIKTYVMTQYFLYFKLFISLVNSKIILSHQLTNKKKTKNHKNEKIYTFKISSIDISEYAQNEK